MIAKEIVKSSFRDPSGFVFLQNGSVYRQINKCYKENYDKLIGSGLYAKLVDSDLLIPHEEVESDGADNSTIHRTIRPETLQFVSYPYEWSFSQLKDSALTTLEIQKTAVEYGMTLKDGNAYNIQFHNGKPILIDTLSFDTYEEGQTWIAYRQFCQHFLAPLALMSYCDVRLSQLLRTYVDGIPLDLASSLLPFGTRLRFGLLSHIHAHSRAQRRYAGKSMKPDRKISRRAFMGLIDSLETAVKKLSWQPIDTEWADYYEDTNYSNRAFEQKENIVAEFLGVAEPDSLWDIGANVGHFSRIAAERRIRAISLDVDPAAVEKNYLYCRKAGIRNCLPLLIDLTNPSPGIGWENKERASLIERGPVECVMALALVHHLCISNNLPFRKITKFFDQLCKWLIIEFVPKSDSQVQRLLRTREDIFPDYTQDGFERTFQEYFAIRSTIRIDDSERIMYLMQRKQG